MNMNNDKTENKQIKKIREEADFIVHKKDKRHIIQNIFTMLFSFGLSPTSHSYIGNKFGIYHLCDIDDDVFYGHLEIDYKGKPVFLDSQDFGGKPKVNRNSEWQKELHELYNAIKRKEL